MKKKKIKNSKTTYQYERKLPPSSYVNGRSPPKSDGDRLNTPSYYNTRSSQLSHRRQTSSYRNTMSSSNKISQHLCRRQRPSYRNKISFSHINTAPRKTNTSKSYKGKQPKKSVKQRMMIATSCLIFSIMCITLFFNLIHTNYNSDIEYPGSYNGSGIILDKAHEILSNCDIDEQNALTTLGWTRIYYGSIGAWTKIVTVQGSPMLTQEFVNKVGEEILRPFYPIIKRYPERLKKVLDRELGTINYLVVKGPADKPYGGGYSGEYIFSKSGDALDNIHEIGHYWDMDDSPGNWRKHVDSVMLAEHIDVIDPYCTYFHPDGRPAYGEFVAEQFRNMFYPHLRIEVKNEFPEVYKQLLNYVPDGPWVRPFPSFP